MYRVVMLLLLLLADQGWATALRNQVRRLVGKELTSSLEIVTKINELDEDGRNALHHAAILGSLPLVEFLILNGVDTRVKDNDGLMPLDRAIHEAETSKSSQQMLVVSHILEKTWGINARDEKGWPPINWTIVSGDSQRVGELIGRGATAFYSISNHRSATFELAQLMQNKEVIDLLISVWGGTIAKKYVQDYNFSKLKELLEMGLDPNAIDEYGNTPLGVATRNPNTEEMVKLLLEAGANPNSANEKGRTPLHNLYRPSKETVKLLLGAGADPNAVDEKGQTPLHTAIWKIREIGRLLVEAGGDPNAVDENGQTPLHCCAWRDSVKEKIGELLEAGGDPNAVDKNGNTPLHLAAKFAYGKMAIELLLKAGANRTTVNKSGNTPIAELMNRKIFPREMKELLMSQL